MRTWILVAFMSWSVSCEIGAQHLVDGIFDRANQSEARSQVTVSRGVQSDVDHAIDQTREKAIRVDEAISSSRGALETTKNEAAKRSQAESGGADWRVISQKKVVAVSWHSEISVLCHVGAKKGETLRILALDNGRFQEIYGPAELTLKKAVEFNCKQ